MWTLQTPCSSFALYFLDNMTNAMHRVIHKIELIVCIIDVTPEADLFQAAQHSGIKWKR